MVLENRVMSIVRTKAQSRLLFGGIFWRAQLSVPNANVTAIEPEMKFERVARRMNPRLLENVITNKRAYPDHSESCMPTKLCPASFQHLLTEVDTFIFDADGVLWLGDAAIPGSPDLIDLLIEKEKRVIVLTNNATKSRAVYAKKLEKLGYNKKLNKNTLVNPAAVVADTLKRYGMGGKKKVYLIGAQGIRDEMDELGIQYFGHGPEPQDLSDGSSFIFNIDLPEDPNQVGAVVVGYEKHFNYHKLMKAANYLKRPECYFFATNEDETCPGPDPKVVIPDAGPLVAAVRCASGKQPITVGKPNTPAFDYISRRWNIDPERTVMVGDRTNTDVKFGRDHGLKTLMVLSGVHQMKDVAENLNSNRLDMVPHYYAKDLASLVP